MSTDQDIVRRWLAENLEAKGRGSRKALAAHLGIRTDAISRMTSSKPGRETRDISASELMGMAEFFGSAPPIDIPTQENVAPIMGFVGAGAEISPEFEQVPPEGLSQVELPFAVPPEIVGFEVKGISMMPVYQDGDVILVYRDQHRPPTSYLGEEAAVRTENGQRFLKRIMRGPEPNTFNLESWNAPTIESVHLAWIGEIYLIVRSGSIRRMNERDRARKRRQEQTHTAMQSEELPFKSAPDHR